jgi:hypothetical protein
MNTTTIIALISSLVLNSFLLIYLFGFIPFALFLSGVTNVLFVSYISYLLRERNEVQSDFFDLLANLETYSNKLLQTYELEMFYGDDTLEDLLNSSKVLVNRFYDYEDKYYNTQEDTPDQGNNLDDRNKEED